MFLIALNVTIDISAIVGTVITAAIIGLASIAYKGNTLLNKISNQIGSNHPPEGILGRVTKAEFELSEIRDWAIRAGYDRRKDATE